MKERAFETDRGIAACVDLSELPASQPQADAVVRGLTEQVAAHFLAHRAPVFRYLRYTCRCQDAEELTQEAFLRLYLALERGDHIESVVKWLFTVARHLVIDKSRHRGPKYVTPVLRQVWDRLADTVPSPQPSCEELLVQESRLLQLQTASECLTDMQRQCLHLRAEGLLYREIADVLGMRVSGVADAVQRAVAKLRDRLRDQNHRGEHD